MTTRNQTEPMPSPSDARTEPGEPPDMSGTAPPVDDATTKPTRSDPPVVPPPTRGKSPAIAFRRVDLPAPLGPVTTSA